MLELDPDLGAVRRRDAAAAARAACCRSRRERSDIDGVVSLNIADPTLYLFDGHNLLHAGGFADLRELRDTLASWVATRGARGVLVFDGAGEDETHGALEVRFAEHADSVIERLASENRERERVCVVSTDATRARDCRAAW